MLLPSASSRRITLEFVGGGGEQRYYLLLLGWVDLAP